MKFFNKVKVWLFTNYKGEKIGKFWVFMNIIAFILFIGLIISLI